MDELCQPRIRPRFHVTAPRNWLNDPNAPLWWNGEWHLFYQHNPAEPVWGLMHWGHLSSADLLTWQDRGIALRPNPKGADAGGCWSGSAQVIDGRPTFFYTGARLVGDTLDQSVLRASADPELNRISTDPGEPLLKIQPYEVGTHGQRDPYLIRREDDWLMVLGTGLPEGRGGAVAAWSSTDTRAWSYKGILFTQPAGGPIETGPVWECPQLVRVGDRWVLLVAVQLPADEGVTCLHTVWFLGALNEETFTPESMGILDAGDVFYAPAVATQQERTLLWGWIQESPELREAGTRDFAGALSTPRELFVHDSHVGVRPAAELARLWGAPSVTSAMSVVSPHVETVLGFPRASSFRVQVSSDPQPGTSSGVILGHDGSGRRVAVALTANGDGTKILLAGPMADEEGHALPFTIDLPATSSTFEVHVDVSIVEVFADGRAITFRVDPELDSRLGVQLFARGGPAALEAQLSPLATPDA